MIQKKSIINTLKRALQTGTFNYMNQQTKQFPKQLFNIDGIDFGDASWWQCYPISKIDVSNNQLTFIPEEVNKFQDLQLIRMKNNLVNVFPGFLGELPNFKSLDLAKNKLVGPLPQNLSNFRSLVELNISENTITHLPNLTLLEHLEFLYINDNKITQLPLMPASLKKLQSSNNNIKQIMTQNFKLCQKLEILNLNKNQIQNIQPHSFSHTSNMISVELKENRLIMFNQMPFSEKLDTIALSFNRIQQFTYFDRCPNLTILILNDNKIKHISKDIIKLKKLKTLDLSNNDLPDLPCQIGFLDALVRIQIQGNPMKGIRQSVKNSGTNQIKKYLRQKMDESDRKIYEKQTSSSFQKVDTGYHWTKLINEYCQAGQLMLKSMGLTELDEKVYQQNIKTLNISDNKVAHISQNVVQIQGLRTLIVNNNQISDLPETLSGIKALQFLEAKNNHLSTLCPKPYKGMFFNHLTYLDLSCNRFNQIPKAILYLINIKNLIFAYNKVRSIQDLLPQEILPQLQILDMSNNQIIEISDKIFNKCKLNYLNIENNNMTKVPTVLGFMKLLGLKIDGNPLKLIKRQVIEKGTVAIMDHLRNKHVGDPPLRKQVYQEQINQEIAQSNEYYQEPRQNRSNFNKQEISQKQQQKPFFKDSPPKQHQISKQQINAKLKQIQFEMKAIQKQIDQNMSMNNIQKMQKKKKMQALMIERNKLMKM